MHDPYPTAAQAHRLSRRSEDARDVNRPALTRIQLSCELFSGRANGCDAVATIELIRGDEALHMTDKLNSTGKDHLLAIFRESSIDVLELGLGGAKKRKRVYINGLAVSHPSTGNVSSDGADNIACWVIDTDYNEQRFFVRHTYFLGANDACKLIKTIFMAEFDADAWSTLSSDNLRPFDKPKSGWITVKVINDFGIKVMKALQSAVVPNTAMHSYERS